MVKQFLYSVLKNRIALLFILIGIFFRFYGIDWGEPFFFHPDERNIAFGVTNLHFPDQLNPRFFAYGSLPIYVIYFLGLAWNVLESFFRADSVHDIFSVSFEKAILVSRFCSAVLSSSLLLLLYFFCLRYYKKIFALVVLFFSVVSVGFVQYSHFGTFEIWLTFFSFVLLYLILCYLDNKKLTYYLYACFALAILVSIKISSIVFLPVVLCFGLFPFLIPFKKSKSFFYVRVFVQRFFYLVLVLVSFYFVTNPFVLLDFSSFFGSIQYEYLVASGKLPVFYTGGFVNSVAVFFQIFRVFPFLVNPIVSVLFFLFLPIVFWHVYIKKSTVLGLVVVFFLVSFLSQAFLYVKWTRYMVPSLPFLYILFVWSLFWIKHRYEKNGRLFRVFFSFVSFLSVLIFLSFFVVVYIQKDTRVAASSWSANNISSSSKIITEPYDLGILPFNSSFSDITILNFYELDTGQLSFSSARRLIEESDVIILPSQRLLRNRVLHPDEFENSFRFYSDLFGSYSYRLVYKTPCDLLCTIAYFGDPVFWLEETSAVFDRPTVYILKKKL